MTTVAQRLLATLPRKVLTLAFIVREHAASVSANASAVPLVTDVLLGEKKRGFGMGKWNGFGGKVDPNDASIVAAAAREIREEANVSVDEADLAARGVLFFTFEGGKEVLEVHVFLTAEFTGEPSESEEMNPRWYAVGDIPYTKMWADDHIWLPHVLAGKRVDGVFHFSSDENELLEHELSVSESST